MPPEPQDASGAAPWEPEQMLADRYRVKECLRRSAICDLHRVQDIFRNDLHLAMRPSPRVLDREGGREWFEQYGKNVLTVPPHANVLTCARMAYAEGMPFLIADNVEGQGWDTAISEGSLVELPQMLDVALQVAQGLEWLHQQGQIHYNVKPANVLIASSGPVKVWKYGEPHARTRAYASPEQAAGDRPLTPATDMWSLAVSVLEMFVGRTAWRSGANAPDALRRYLQSGPARNGIVPMPIPVAELLARCLRTDPDERPAGMGKVVNVLRDACEDAAAEPEPPSPDDGQPSAPGRRRFYPDSTASPRKRKPSRQ